MLVNSYGQRGFPQFMESPQVCSIGLANDVTTPCVWNPTAIGLQKELLTVRGMQGLGGLGGTVCSLAVVVVVVGIALWANQKFGPGTL